MPTGIYTRTEKHSFNKGRKYPNRKKYYKGISLTDNYRGRNKGKGKKVLK